MRDLLLFGIVLSTVPWIIMSPYVGVLLWSWFTFMNPHREVFGFAHDFAFNYYIALFTLAAWALSRERSHFRLDTTTTLFGLFAVWMSITTYFAIDHPWSYELWDRHIKTFVLIFAVSIMINSKVRIHAMVWIIAVSLGYFAVKGGGFLLLTGGQFRVFGPVESMIEDNNHFAVALLVVIPLINYLRQNSELRIVSLACLGVMVLSIVSVVGTYSRGGLFGLAVVLGMLLLRSSHKMGLVLLAGAAIVILPVLVPQEWYERMDTIQTYEQDASFQGRVDAWQTSWNIAVNRPLGGGFSSVEQGPIFSKYGTLGSVEEGTAAHSIYFQVLGDHGFIGLTLYILILFSAWRNAAQVMRISRSRSDLAWAVDLANMTQVSIVGFAAGGALLSMAYYDMLLVLVAVSSALLRLVQDVALGHEVTARRAFVPRAA